MTDFEKQKQDAIERVKKMNQLYRQRVGVEKEEPKIEKETYFKNKNTSFDIMKLIRFDAVKGDPDRLLILGILMLLWGENTDQKLIYALLYIMV